MNLDCPSWYNYQDRATFNELMRKKDEELSEQEKWFCRTMYHLMEVACGVD